MESSINIRKLNIFVGVMALFFPIVLILLNAIFFNDFEQESSISHYYYTPMRSLFTIVLTIASFYFYIYDGYNGQANQIRNIIAACALGVAIIPTSPTDEQTIYGIMHLIFAVVFFSGIGYIILFLFTSSSNFLVRETTSANSIYKVCGFLIFLSIATMGVLEFVLGNIFHYDATIFMGESVCLLAMGVAWLTKAGFKIDAPIDSMESMRL